MDRKLKVGGLVVLALVPLLIAASGGFPSRPRFVAVGVNQAASAAVGSIVSTQSGTPNTGNAVFTSDRPTLTLNEGDASTGNRVWRIYAQSSGLWFDVCDDLPITTCSASQPIATRSGNTPTPAYAPRMAATSVVGGTGALLAPTYGVSGAVRNSVGNYTVTLSPAFTNAACVASTRAAGNNEVLSVGNGVGTVLVTAVDGSTSANTDVTFTVMCLGT